MNICYPIGPRNHEKWRFLVIIPKNEGCKFPMDYVTSVMKTGKILFPWTPPLFQRRLWKLWHGWCLENVRRQGQTQRNAYFPLYGGFLEWWYPQIIHFNRDFHYKSSILGYPYFWNTHMGGFKNDGFPQQPLLFLLKNSNFGVFWGYRHLRKHPYILLCLKNGILTSWASEIISNISA